MDAKVFADDQPDIPGHAVLFEENIVFADDNVKNWIIKWTGWDDVPFDINGDSLSFGPFCFEDCNLESLTLYSLSLPVYDHDPNIAENMKFLLYGGHVQTLYTPDPSLYQGNPEWRSGNAVDNYAMIPDYEVYYHTHY